MQEVSEPSLESPRPPMAVSRQGRRETSLIGCPPCTPACWRPYPSAPLGAPTLLALPLLFPCVSLCWFPAMARCRKLVSPPLSPPARPSGGRGRGTGRPVVPPWPPRSPAPATTHPSAPLGAPSCLFFPCSSIVRCLLSTCFPSFS